MSEETTIRLDEPDTSGHALAVRFDDPADEDRFREGEETSAGRIRIRIAGPEQDTEGHAAVRSATVRALLLADDDTEGHAISLRFPSTQEADAFRRRLLAGGVLAGTLVLGAAAGAAVSSVANQAGEPMPGVAPAPAVDTQPGLDDITRPPRSGIPEGP